jgi:uncharacterized protein YjdB
MKKLIPFLLILCLLLTACTQKGNNTESTGNSESAAKLLTLYPAYLQVPLGQHVTLEAKAAGGKAVTWSSSNPSVASVDENGRITPVSEGETIITVALADDPSVTDACGVLVTEDGNIFFWEK